MKKSKRTGRRIMLPLTTIVGLGFGAFVAISIGLVLGLSVSANFRNTFSLLNDKTILSTQALETQLRTHFVSVENAMTGTPVARAAWAAPETAGENTGPRISSAPSEMAACAAARPPSAVPPVSFTSNCTSALGKFCRANAAEFLKTVPMDALPPELASGSSSPMRTPPVPMISPVGCGWGVGWIWSPGSDPSAGSSQRRFQENTSVLLHDVAPSCTCHICWFTLWERLTYSLHACKDLVAFQWHIGPINGGFALHRLY